MTSSSCSAASTRSNRSSSRRRSSKSDSARAPTSASSPTSSAHSERAPMPRTRQSNSSPIRRRRTLSNEHEFFVEIEAPTASVDRNTPEGALVGEIKHYSGTSSAAAQVLSRLKMDLSQVFDQVKTCIDLAAARICPGPDGPSETSIEFGVKISADGNVIVATVGSEVHLTISAKWQRG